MSVRAQAPEFPPDPGELYIPPTVIVMGQEVEVDTTATVPEEVDVFGDSTVIYNPEENTLTLSNVNLLDDTILVAISYAGSEPLIIVLCDSSTIVADSVIISDADVIITGEGTLVAEGIVPLRGSNKARITFDGVTLTVRSLKSHESVRRRVKGVMKLDESGGPALSGFASADFNKTNVTPPDAEYGEVEMEESSGGTTTINALYVVTEDGDVEVVTEFSLTAEGEIQAVEQTRTYRKLDITQPMYNILGLQVDATYKGIVVQQGQTYLLQ